jgi:hypothetical protein
VGEALMREKATVVVYMMYNNAAADTKQAQEGDNREGYMLCRISTRMAPAAYDYEHGTHNAAHACYVITLLFIHITLFYLQTT